MRVISHQDVTQLLPMHACIEIMENALQALSAGEAEQQLRTVVPVAGDNVFGLMPGYLKQTGVVGVKLLSIFPANHHVGLPSHQGTVSLFDAKTGTLQAVIDGSKITAIRTAAVSAVATKLLARPQSDVLAMLGTGEQARTHVEAMLQVRPFRRIQVWGPTKTNALRFQQEMAEKFSIPVDVCDSAEAAVQDADVICTVTASKEPILEARWVKSGVHLNVVGASQASHRELASNLVKQSLFFVDRVESAVHESGDYLIPLKEGVIGRDHIRAEIGDLLLGKKTGRMSNGDITVLNRWASPSRMSRQPTLSTKKHYGRARARMWHCERGIRHGNDSLARQVVPSVLCRCI